MSISGYFKGTANPDFRYFSEAAYSDYSEDGDIISAI
jgi:hypothetical protein